jgi:hypothetical protein
MRKRSGFVTLTSTPDQDLTHARELLLADPKVLYKKVSRLAATNGPQAEALFTLAAGKKFDYTPDSWKIVIDRLDNCEAKVGDWLEALGK